MTNSWKGRAASGGRSRLDRPQQNSPAAVYVHIPFCAARCHYCDFVSSVPGVNTEARENEQVNTYLELLLAEAELYRDAGPMRSLYLGGGTPTFLTAGQLYRLLGRLREVFVFAADAEITVEGNPGTIDKGKLEAMKTAGCNRLSLGVQSFDDRMLRVLGRIHNAADVYDTFAQARQTGFDNISLDLMYGLPGQQPAEWGAALKKAAALEPEHISLYQLNIEKGTPFFSLSARGLLPDFAEETALAMYDQAITYLTGVGYGHYEISNFAKAGRQSRHNRVYWENREYVGLGAGAAGYLAGRRYSNFSEISEYCGALLHGMKPVAEEERIDKELAMSETMFLGLRLTEGVGKEEFFLRHGIQITGQYGEAIDKLTKLGLLEEAAGRIRLTRRGLYLANQAMLEFLR